MDQGKDVILHMEQQAADWELAGDKRAVFLRCYTLMTSNMLGALADGRFRDPAWMEGVLCHFADYYFRALDAFEQHRPDTPPVWQFAHDQTLHRPLHVLQHLLLGINAHINYDLALTLYDALAGHWADLSHDHRREKYEDHCLVNRIIGETIDIVQDTVVERYDPAMDLIDRLFGRLDERLLSALITRWRHQVWEQAIGLLETPAAADREALRAAMEARVMKWARLLARPI